MPVLPGYIRNSVARNKHLNELRYSCKTKKKKQKQKQKQKLVNRGKRSLKETTAKN